MKHDFGTSVANETASSTARSRSARLAHGTASEIRWIFDPSFRYTPSYATDLRKTFERIRLQLQSQDCGASRKPTGEKVLRLESRKTGLT